MVLGFTMEQATVIYFILIYLILAAINIIYYNPMVISIVQYFPEFSIFFFEPQFLSENDMLKPVLGVKFIFDFFFFFFLTFENGEVRQHFVPVISFVSSSGSLLPSNFVCNCSSSFFLYLKGQKSPVAFSQEMHLQEVQFLFRLDPILVGSREISLSLEEHPVKVA